MRNYKQPILTIVIIFATAYVLTLIGCSPSHVSHRIAINPANPTATSLPASEAQPQDNEISTQTIVKGNAPAHHLVEEYDNVQQGSSLIVDGANLYLDTSIIATLEIQPGYVSDIIVGHCVVSNQSNRTVKYFGQKALLIEALIYPDSQTENYGMLVMKTSDGVKFECSGLDYISVTSSKAEVMDLLKDKNTDIKLSYELN